MFCVNLCEVFNPYLFHNVDLESFINYLSKKYGEPVSRIYLGSSFCSQYFLLLSGYEHLFQLCAKFQIPVTLTLPVFSEKDLDTGKNKIANLCKASSGIIDEITVNDIGMLSFVQSMANCKINLGRLFFKDPRDCRVPALAANCARPMLLSHLNDSYWSKFHFSSIELDPTNKFLDTSCLETMDIEVGIHFPYCYMTTGNICKFASIHRPPEQKFRPNQKCHMECAQIYDFYSGHVVQTNCDPVLYRIGRTLYYEAEAVKLIGKSASRMIFFPINELREFANENTGSVKQK